MHPNWEWAIDCPGSAGIALFILLTKENDMKLKDYVKGLQELMEQYPETAEYECVYAIDAEGNGYEPVESNGTIAEMSWMIPIELVDTSDAPNENTNAVIIN